MGKILGMKRAMKGGIGSASIQVGSPTVAALAAVNAAGDIMDPQTGKLVAGARTTDGRGLADTVQQMLEGKAEPWGLSSRTPLWL